eukprot:1915973-Alexandrium_andersonii.AAC.1
MDSTLSRARAFGAAQRLPGRRGHLDRGGPGVLASWGRPATRVPPTAKTSRKRRAAAAAEVNSLSTARQSTAR